MACSRKSRKAGSVGAQAAPPPDIPPPPPHPLVHPTPASELLWQHPCLCPANSYPPFKTQLKCHCLSAALPDFPLCEFPALHPGHTPDIHGQCCPFKGYLPSRSGGRRRVPCLGQSRQRRWMDEQMKSEGVPGGGNPSAPCPPSTPQGPGVDQSQAGCQHLGLPPTSTNSLGALWTNGCVCLSQV